MAAQQLAFPLSVIAAGSMIVAAFVFTRAARGPSPAPTVPVVAPPVVEPTPAPVVRPVPVLTPEIMARGRENAGQALERMRAEIVTKCWQPSAAANPEPRQVKVGFNFSFTPQGTLAGVGILEDRAASRADVSECLRSLVTPLVIPAPGVPLTVDVPFVLP